MKQSIITQIQSMRLSMHQLIIDENSALDDEQSEDINHILTSLDSMEELTSILDALQEADADRMQILHDLTSPVNNIIGYLYILEQEYNSPLNQQQRQTLKRVTSEIHQLYRFISKQLLSPQTDS